jgi:3-dehydro-L-gulonate 2-dehydrogenase
MQVSFYELSAVLEAVLLRLGFSPSKAAQCANIFATNSRDGVHSHGLNRFPVFVRYVRDGYVDKDAEPEHIASTGIVEHWDGHLAPGMYNATICMNRAIELARQHGIGCVTLRNTNHWMRGGTYGWQAAEGGCVGICTTNAEANMPAWGGDLPALGNNPLVIAVPRKQGHVVLDMALSQFSYGKLQEFQMSGQQLPVSGGYDAAGDLSNDPAAIRASRRTLPIGFWKGSGLSMLIDMLVAGLSGGRSVAAITKAGTESAVSQLFLCLDAASMDAAVLEDIIGFAKAGSSNPGNSDIRYPGEKTLHTREESEKEGITVNAKIWQEVNDLLHE